MDVKQIGLRIKTLREKAKLTQEEAAGLAHIHTRALQRLEAGQGNPTLNTLLAVGSALGATPLELYSESNSAQKSQSARRQSQPEGPSLADAVALLGSYGQASTLRRLSALFLLSRDDKYLDQIRDLPGSGPIALALSKLPKAL